MMKILQDFDIERDQEELNSFLKDYPGGCALTIGKFDGIHRGHMELIKAVVDRAKQAEMTARWDNPQEKGGRIASVVIAFGKATYAVVNGTPKPCLTTSVERRLLLQNTGIDLLVEFPFTESLRSMDAGDFVQVILKDCFRATFVAVGTDFCFGKNRGGNAQLLAECGKTMGFEAQIIEKVQENGVDIGSTIIAELVSAGKMETANHMLGYPYFVLGRVEEGAKLGRKMGFPTINQSAAEEKLLPPNGVYVSRTFVMDEETEIRENGGMSDCHFGEKAGSIKCYGSVTNVGTKPTVSAGIRKTIETNLFDYEGNLYGRMVRVELLSFTRPERPFSGMEELSARIGQDAVNARNYLEKFQM